ncbi:hypothetical protein HPF90_0357, partial [Helicobacter pylori]
MRVSPSCISSSLGFSSWGVSLTSSFSSSLTSSFSSSLTSSFSS